jgi:predicted ATPase/class 3 adenylate cyclase
MIPDMRLDLPSGTVTFLFTDVEGSTNLLHDLGTVDYAEALAEHRHVIREACTSERGVEVDTQGDAFFFAFPTAPGAIAAASAFTEILASGQISVRVGLHTGTPLLTEEGYVGGDVHRAARIAAAGHGGQVLVSASTAQLVELELTDLGEHRLKDLSAPERIYQLGVGDFPALTSLYRTNLPVPATPFLGRARELSEVVELLADDDARLLTLTGPGGTGKTRLALQAAAMASDAYPDGVWWVPLAALHDPALVLATAAHTLGSKNGLAEHIADKRLLCLFDNFEQVVEAAPDLAALVSDCPNLDVLVTSRERLRVRGEQTYPVPPLAETDGLTLFVTRARAVDPAFVPSEAVRELCLRLDELPLALELAAARTALFSPEQLLEKLSQRLDLLKGERDADPRQQTLRATIEWSYDLLADDEQRLFARLAVFSGGSTYDAAEVFAGADPDILQSLLDKSLLRRRDSPLGPRYWMLETIREYATERLEASGEAEVLRRRHAEWLLALARALEPHAPVAKEWLDSLESEHDNLRVALDRLPVQADTELALSLAEAVWRFWKMRGHQLEAQRQLERLLALDQDPTVARGHALNAAAGMAVENGEYATGSLHAEQALAIHRGHGDAWGIARATYMLGYAAIESGDFEAARPLFEDTVSLMAELGHEQYVGQATFNLGWALEELGERELAEMLAHENLLRARTIGSKNLEAAALDTLAGFAHDDGCYDVALSLKRDALRLDLELGDTQHVLDSLGRIANTHAHAGHGRLAAQLLSASLALHVEAGMMVPLYQKRRNQEMLEVLHEQLNEPAFVQAWEEGAKLSLDDAVALALGDDNRDAARAPESIPTFESRDLPDSRAV